MSLPTDFDIRFSEESDLPWMEQWFAEEGACNDFPFGVEEKEQALRNWIGFSKYKASLTGLWQGEPCAVGTLFLMPYRKVAHHASFYLIVAPPLRGRGIGTSMVCNLLNLGKTRFRLESLHVEIYEPSLLLPILEGLRFELFCSPRKFYACRWESASPSIIGALSLMILSDLTIRWAEEGDEKYLVEWLLQPGILRWFPLSDLREVEDAARIWMGYAKLQSALTAVYQGVPCGTATLYINPYKKLAHQALFAIIVSGELRGKGIGTRLLSDLIALAKDRFQLELLHLEVYDDNPAIHLYRRLGFREYGYQRHFAKEEGGYIGKILMEKNLRGE